MIYGANTPVAATDVQTSRSQPIKPEVTSEADVALRFEQMLWAEMLTHAGLEEVLTKNGGEAASAFSRFVVEEIAADIAEKHPLGLAENQAANTEGFEK